MTARLAIGIPLPGGGMTAPLLPFYARESVDFRDLLHMHLVADFEEARVSLALEARNGR